MGSLNAITNPLLHIVLDRPQIAANVAAIVRLCNGMACALHVCGPLVFEATDSTKWRAGLDYFFGARVHFHQNIDRCLKLLGQLPWIVEMGGSKTPWDVSFKPGNVVCFGPESGSVNAEIMAQHPDRILTLPQLGMVRSLNLAQCAAVVTFEALRQNRDDFLGHNDI